MAERPTPHSVAVCTLIALHSDPSSLIHKASTPHNKLNSKRSNKVGNNSTNDVDNGNNDNIDKDSLSDIEEHLSKVVKYLVFHSETNMPLRNLLNLVAGRTGIFSHAAEFLLEDLKQSCLSIDSLVDLYAALRSTIAQGIVDGDSAHGIYVRKHCLGFDELAFESVGRFWESFCDYVTDADGDDIQDDHHVVVNSDDDQDPASSQEDTFVTNESMPLEDKKLESSMDIESNWPLAPHQISRILFRQSLNLEQEFGMESYVGLEAKIQEILMENPELTLAHFLRFLNNVMHGERVGALESFHRYFDYAMIQERKFKLCQSSLPNDNNNNNTNNNNNNNRNGHMDEGNTNNTTGLSSSSNSSSVLQYSAVLLASLFHKFANDELANIATKEAIRVAQQSGDEACLAYALGWLHASNPNAVTANSSISEFSNSGLDLLTRVSNRAAQLNIPSLVAGASLMQANYIAMGGDNDREVTLSGLANSISLIPAQAWDSIAAASTQGTILNNLGSTSFAFDIPTHARNLDSSSDVMATFAQQHMSGGGLWNSIGHTSMASTSFQTTMRCFEDRLTNEQYRILAREIASSAVYGTGSEKSYFSHESSDAQSLCSSLEQLRLTSKGRNLGFDSGASGLQPSSVYQLAMRKLRDILFETSAHQSIQWNHDVITLLHESSTRKSNICCASSLNTLLHTCAPFASRDFAKISIELLGQTSSLYCRQRKWELAKHTILEKIIPLCEVNRFHYFHAYFLLQLSLIYFESSPNDSIKALTPILSCLSLAEKYSIDVIHASSLSLLARLHFEQGNLPLARSLLNASMPVITQNANIVFQGDALLCMAKCYLAEAKTVSIKLHSSKAKQASSERKRTSLVKKAISQLEKSQKQFEKVVDVIRLREVYYLMAQCHASLSGHTSRRNLAAKSFREMNRIKVQDNLPTWYDAIENIKRSMGLVSP